ncbi:MAG TPA: secretin N-terminal domain-containing protein [Planctomycetota bacterium]|nr:secretin N-terminal domain-containing protein [Planctomycetota bacterium]
MTFLFRRRDGAAAVRVFAWSLALSATAATVRAQETRPETQPEGGFEFRMDPAGMPIETLIQQAQNQTGKTFIYSDQSQIAGKKVRLVGTFSGPRREAFSFYQAILLSQNFALVPLGDEETGLYLIENIDQSRALKQRAIYVPHAELARYRNEVGTVIMTSIPLRYVKVGNIRGAYQQILQNRNAEFTQEVESANSLIVVAFAPTVYALKQIIEVMDVPQVGATMKFEMLPLKFAVAEELQPIITDLIKGEAGQAGGAPRPRIVNPAEGGGGTEKPEPKIIADPRTNALIVYAVESDMNQIKRLVAALDTEVKEPLGNIRIYFLKNTNADDMEETLRDVLGQGSGARGARATGVRSNAGGPTSTDARGQEVSIVADPNNNALIITSTPTRYREIEDIIRRLDQRRPQVLVQAAIAELSDSDIRNIGVEITAIAGGDGYNPAFATGFGLSTVQVTSSTPSINSLRRVPLSAGGAVNVNGGVFGVFDDDLNVPFLVQLIRTKNKSNLVSVPSVLTNDNEESRIEVARQVGTSQFGTTTAGTDREGFGGYEDAKIELIISPHISNDNYLRLEVELSVEAFVGQRVSPEIPPDKSRRHLRGSVTLQSGRTVVIGGLVQDNDTETEQAVPFLSDIPLLGELFKRTEKIKEKTTLYVFITPTIFNTFEALEEISYDRKLEISKLEGQVRLVDPNFRPILIDDASVPIGDIEGSGSLDMPRYAPMAPAGAEPPVDGHPVRPRATPADARTDSGPGRATTGGI